jgi:hypothetical protein
MLLWPTKSQAWREGFSLCQRAIDGSVGQHFARTYGLADETAIPNDSPQQRILHAEALLYDDTEKLEGYLACWIRPLTRESYQMVVWAQAEVRQQASPQLRQAMHRYLEDGKLDRIF